MEIVLAADLVVASDHAPGSACPRWPGASCPPAVGCSASARALPLNIAKELLLTGDQLLPQRADELGLVNRLTEPGEALDAAVALAERICVNAPVSVRQSLWALETVLTAHRRGRMGRLRCGHRVVRGTDDFRGGPHRVLREAIAQLGRALKKPAGRPSVGAKPQDSFPPLNMKDQP